MAECGQRLQPTTLAPRLLRERQNCGWYLGNLPPKRFIRRNRLTCQGFLNSRHWVFVKEDNFRKDCPPHQSPKDAFLPLIHRGAPSATPEKRQSTLLKGATLLSKLSKAGKAFLEDVEAEAAQHPLTLYPQLTEALPAELLLQVLEVLDPERKLEDVWAYCQDTRKPMKEPTELVGKRSSQERPPKKTLISRSGQWLCEEKSSKVDSLYKDRLLHDDVHRGVTDFCHWAEDLDKLFINRPPSLREHCGHWSEPRSSGRANPQKPKRVKMRYGAWYLNTSLWKRQRADEPLVDPMVSHKAQDSTFKEQLQEQFLEKIYAEEKNKSENIKAPKKLTQTEKNPGSR
ncbi:protein FAM47E isoform X3 [Mus musculus]|uniref:protein FAM47E isoform X3 n=2 Tax=Mus musculus TaxID=10090 RepID=UPI001673EC19|nr:protein FAM47E isoform X3 [Mus musculus]